MRHKLFTLALLLLVTPVHAQTRTITLPRPAAAPRPSAANLEMSNRLQAFTGGVGVILRLYGEGQAGRTGSPNDFRAAFALAMSENQALVAATDARMAALYATIYPAPLMAAALSFYESPIGRAMAEKHRNALGQITWPDPGDTFLSREESAALRAFNANVLLMGDAAQKNPDAMDGVLSAETDAIIKLRQAANAKYCQNHDCAKEGIK